ncbi:MAG: protein kinase [Planctomycetes bacterium]|nr:protein kinase [Planctomycetota bacterium]
MSASEATRLDSGSRVAVRDRRERSLRQLEISRRLAQGAHSATYLARDAEAKRWVVVKAAHQGGEDTELAIEEQILLQLKSPHLVQLIGGGADARLHKVLAYERLYPNPLLLLSRADVRAQFPDDPGGRYCPLPPRLALAFTSDLFRGLAHLHTEGFVHHDVKLGNLLVAIDDAEGETLTTGEILIAAAEGRTRGVLIDFGAARSAAFLSELNSGEVDESEIAPQLTPVYAPPEALLEVNGRRTLLPSLDLYAAAIVSYSLFCGRTAYEHLGVSAGDVPRLLEVKAEEQQGRELPISFDFLTQTPGMAELGKELFGFLSCCLSGDPSQRPTAQEASAFCDELQGWYLEALAAAPGAASKPHEPEGASEPATGGELNFQVSRSDRWRRATVRRRRDPSLKARTETPSTDETTSKDGFATSAESAVSAQRLREEGAALADAERAEAQAPEKSLGETTPVKSKRPPTSRPMGRVDGKPPSDRLQSSGVARRPSSGPLDRQSPVKSKRLPTPQPQKRVEGKSPAAPRPGAGQAKRPSSGPLDRQARPRSKRPPTSRPLRRVDGKPPSGPLRATGQSTRPSSGRMKRADEKPPSDRLHRTGQPPRPSSGRMRRADGPPPSQGMRRPDGPPPSKRMKRPEGPPPSKRMKRADGPPPSKRMKRPEGPPPSQGMKRPGGPPPSQGMKRPGGPPPSKRMKRPEGPTPEPPAGDE